MRLISLFSILLFSARLCAQQGGDDAPVYPKDYFRNPLNIPILLAGNFGECRPNHFHSGIDIKTNGKENLPVFAAAEGYVSRIKMEKGGFGHALYVTHPGGFTTLYAHLNNFTPALQSYLKKYQYEKESWSVDIPLSPTQFQVKKGQQIAWSGNTGASSAPHLHFEIRDSKTEHPLNAMLFGLPIIDTRPPVPTQISVYDLNQSIYEQPGQFVALRRTTAGYTTSSDTISVNTNMLGIGINVNDFMNGSDNTLNFYTADLYLDEQLQTSIRLDDIGYEVTRYLHAYVDYKSRKQKNQWYQLLFQLSGNTLSQIYPFLNSTKGGLVLTDNDAHRIRIELRDAIGNSTTIGFSVMSVASTMARECPLPLKVNAPSTFERSNISFSLDAEDLYDGLCLEYSEKKDESSLSNRHQVHYPYVPVHTFFDLKIKPDKRVAFSNGDKVAMMYSDGKAEDGRAASFESGWYKASVRNFGNYWLVSDTVPPVITTLQKEGANLSKAARITFRVKEDITSVKKFRAELDGKWLMFEPKGDTFFYAFDEHCPKGRHKLVISASDENNNTKSFVYTFTR
jgi:hypothetical protein